jgi:WXG100 family type VII secretion target
MATTEVLTSKLTEVAKNVNDLVQKYNKSILRVYEIGSELDTMWDGEANQKFNAMFANDRERFNAMSSLLTRYTETLNQAASIYAKAESDAIQTIATNKVR